MTTAHLLSLQLDELIRTATQMRADLAGGKSDLADARILRMQAQCVECLIELQHVENLRALPERTAEEDKASQVYLERGSTQRGAA